MSHGKNFPHINAYINVCTLNFNCNRNHITMLKTTHN